MSRRRIAIIHPKLRQGGSEACALWTLEALIHDHDVTFISSEAPNWSEINDFYGTIIEARRLSQIVVPAPFFLAKRSGFVEWKYAPLARWCLRHSSAFDLMISTYNPMNFGVRGIQYILDPTFNNDLVTLVAGRPGGFRGWFYRSGWPRRIYLGVARKISGANVEGFRKNVTLVDSDWTGHIARKHLGIEVQTLYPPVRGCESSLPWAERESGFICLGRIDPEKKIETLIRILSQVRTRNPEIHLHVIGATANKLYLRRLRPLLREHRDWVDLTGPLSRSETDRMLAMHRYGIHGRAPEPFGIAVAEMVRAGCLVWVPDHGGQTEIVTNALLQYRSPDDAVEKIRALLGDVKAQSRIRESLRTRGEIFSALYFMRRMREIVAETLCTDGAARAEMHP